ncbi:MAG: hypothetical protein C4576_30330 [Desulfobacteraceae bacterium]|nr:MAG: hypothetical protein C4576_30330 [Desulfobacteraceae bacterium]
MYNSSEHLLYEKQVNQLLRHTPVGIIGTTINSLILTFVLWEVIPLFHLVTWLTASISVSAYRYFLYKRYLRTKASASATRLEIWFNIGIGISGLIWGSAAIFLFPSDIPHQTFLAFVLGGMVAGAAGTFSVVLRSFLIFSTPTLVPIVVRFFAMGDHIHFAMGGMSFLFGLLMFWTATRVNSAIRSSLQLQFEATERAAELERKTQELQDFAFVASHDLSEPLRKVQAFGSLLRDKELPAEKQKDYISRMIEATNRMQTLLDALLRYSRVESRGDAFTTVDLNVVVKEAVSDLEVQLNETGTMVEIGTLPTFVGDPSQMRQLFQNLIANSVKYRRSGVDPIIKIYGNMQNGVIQLSVQDNGIGFDERYLDKIFRPFQRLHGRHEYPGIGMGLAICKKIVERHGGVISAKSKPGEGSTFILSLPIQRITAESLSSTLPLL